VTNGGTTTSSGNVRLLWQQPFEKLRSSADDNEHLLTLDFHGEEGVVVRKRIVHLLSIHIGQNSSLIYFILSRNWISARPRSHLSSICMHFYQPKPPVLVLAANVALFLFLLFYFLFEHLILLVIERKCLFVLSFLFLYATFMPCHVLEPFSHLVHLACVALFTNIEKFIIESLI
jgi:hypothetical protein